jgi:purine-binding chemotaxis protein CheW
VAAPIRPLDSAGSRETSSRSRCMCVSVAAASYGLPLEHVQEVIAARPVTRVFHAPAALAGIINLRGEVLPILDLSQLLRSVLPTAKQADVRIVVVRELAGLKRRAGLRVDALLGLLDVPAQGLNAAPSAVAGGIRTLVVGVIPTSPPCAVLDIESLLSAPELALLAGNQPAQ